MDSPSPSRQSGFLVRNSSVDVSQLDKINAIPNKTADNVLLTNLCQEDQHYLKFLMENDSSDSGEELEKARRNSSGAWSPMVQSPMVNKRKGVKPSFQSITLSLEDISYIRPSWGISKGIRTIEVDGKKKINKLKAEKSDPNKELSKKSEQTNSNEMAYKYFLVLLTLVVIFLTLPPYLAEQKRYNNQIIRNKLKVDKKSRTIEIYRPDSSSSSDWDQQQQLPIGDPILKVDFALGVPENLKPEECTCNVYDAELIKMRAKFNLTIADTNDRNDQFCFSCLDWAVRANFRVLVEHKSDTDICYYIKWQSYDSLATPLIDCFSVEKNDQWFGLGDIQSSEWALNRLDFTWIPLATNLTAESIPQTNHHSATILTGSQMAPSLGSYANFTLFSTSGIFIGDLKSDFRLSIKVDQDDQDRKRICIKASCNEKCSSVWSRVEDLTEFRYANNLLEYKICSSMNAKSLISSHIEQKVQLLDALVKERTAIEGSETVSSNQMITMIDNRSMWNSSKPYQFERLLEKESQSQLANSQQQQQQPTPTAITPVDPKMLPTKPPNSTNIVISSSTNSLIPEGIGLIERTIFSTSPEFMPVLDGKTLRQYVDSVVKMGLKTSLILSIDSRWETYIGSLQLNTALFPKWRLLFEIIHNKGFKVLLTMKPFVDTVIGAASVNQLFEAGKLYGISQGLNRVEQDVRQRETILRRNSLFSIRNETIEIGQNGSTTSRPYVFKCKESQVGYCVLLDLNREQTRLWLQQQIGRSELFNPSSNTPSAADGILLAGSHPDGFSWEDHYREGFDHLVHGLFFKERIFTIGQWTGNLGYIQLASRPFTWDGLRSVINSVLNLGIEGFSLIHPGSVWGDLNLHSSSFSPYSSQSNASIGDTKTTSTTVAGSSVLNRPQVVARKDVTATYLEDFEVQERSQKELSIRWLQVSIFLPILQFNNLAPIERFNLQELLQNLVKIRKLNLISELKKNLPYTPLISQSKFDSTTSSMMMPLIRPVWFNQQHVSSETPDSIVTEQFSIGPDILVAPVLSEGVRQRDIYLPNGFWHDELRQINVRGGKWLRNYPIELHEIAWFTKVKR